MEVKPDYSREARGDTFFEFGGRLLLEIWPGRFCVHRGPNSPAIGEILEYAADDYRVVDRNGKILADHVETLEAAVAVFDRMYRQRLRRR
jgi:hypothetical protein